MTEAYWSGVGARLLAQLRARFAIALLSLLFAIVVIGPVVWTQAPDLQNAARALLAVGTPSQRAELLNPSAALAAQVTQFQATSANSVEVLLQWPQQPAARFYRLLRTQGDADQSNGLPLALLSAEQLSFSDGFALRPGAYHYSLHALDADYSVLHSQGFTVAVRPAITAFDAALLAYDRTEKQVLLPAHPLGSDRLGRDMLARLLQGGRVSLTIGIVGPLLFVVFGAVYGAIAASGSARVDNWMMRACDLVVALPFLLFMILLKVALGGESGSSGMWPIIAALFLLSWPGTARLVRAEVLALRGHAYIEAARLMGAGRWYLLRRHFLPNVLPVILVSFSFAIPAAIFTEAFLSFLGLGISAPATSWGSLCYVGMSDLAAHPHLLLLPSAAIAMTVLGFNLLGDALRDALDVKLDARL